VPTRQHGAVEASDALLAIERHAGVKPVELHKIRRQDPALGRDYEERKRIRLYRKLGCITAMLMCLDRRQRMAFILGEVFGETSEVGAEAMGESTANFRQLLSRARHDLYQFMNEKCGLVNQANPCRCARKANGFMRNGWLDANNLQFSKDRIAAVRDVAADRLHELQLLDRKHAEFYRMQPFLAEPDLAQKLCEVLSQSGFDTN
jgi:Sigma-70, region 4